jgi:hypothetical protein
LLKKKASGCLIKMILSCFGFEGEPAECLSIQSELDASEQQAREGHVSEQERTVSGHIRSSPPFFFIITYILFIITFLICFCFGFKQSFNQFITRINFGC